MLTYTPRNKVRIAYSVAVMRDIARYVNMADRKWVKIINDIICFKGKLINFHAFIFLAFCSLEHF